MLDNLDYSLQDLDFPQELNELSKAIRYSHTVLHELGKLESLDYEHLSVFTLYRKLIENTDAVLILNDYGLESPSDNSD